MSVVAPALLYECEGGSIVLPASDLVLVDRRDGGNLVVNPPRRVWERSCLSPEELASWAFLVAATGEAMLAELPQLDGGCINYWEAGNWALNIEANPHGPKTAPNTRAVHMHLLGRSTTAVSADWTWGEAPRFPTFAERHNWAAANSRLTVAECTAVVAKTATLLTDKYAMVSAPLLVICNSCGCPKGSDHACMSIS